MSSQLVVSINSTADYFRWCWLGDDCAPAAGDLAALRTALGDVAQQAWLLLPGAKVVTRRLEYTEKEKKHLRNLLPFQLEESVVGDVEDLHVALGAATAGKVTLAYTDKEWLKAIFAQFANIGLEITRCWARPQLLPLQAPVVQAEPLMAEPRHSVADARGETLANDAAVTEIVAAENAALETAVTESAVIEPAVIESAGSKLAASDAAAANPQELISAGAIWSLGFEAGQVNVRFAEQEGFSVPLPLLPAVLELLITTQNLSDNLPSLVLCAPTQAELDKLLGVLPSALAARVSSQILADFWQLEFNGKAIDLCQAEFSQRLPLARWFKLWRGVGILAAVTLVVYVSVLGFNIHKLNKQNLQLRQQMEALYRTVVPNGQADDPEKRLRSKLQQLQPKVQTSSVVALLAGVFPVIAANTDVTVKVISYSAESGEMSINVQAHSFNSIDALRQAISAKGYTAELLTANAQGDLNSGRIKITKPQQ